MADNNTTPEDSEGLTTLPTNTRGHLSPNKTVIPPENDCPPHLAGGRLLHFAHIWEASTSDKWVLTTLRHGYLIDFYNLPHDHFVPSPMSQRHKKHKLMLQAIDHLLQIGAIEQVPSSETYKGCYSILFIVPKKDGSWRAILDLKWVNKFARKRRSVWKL